MAGRDGTYRKEIEDTDSDASEEGAAALQKKAEGTRAGTQPQTPSDKPRVYFYEKDASDREIQYRVPSGLRSDRVSQTQTEEEIKEQLQPDQSWDLGGETLRKEDSREIPTDYPGSNMGVGEYSTMLADRERREADSVWPPQPSAGRGYSLQRGSVGPWPLTRCPGEPSAPTLNSPSHWQEGARPKEGREEVFQEGRLPRSRSRDEGYGAPHDERHSRDGSNGASHDERPPGANSKSRDESNGDFHDERRFRDESNGASRDEHQSREKPVSRAHGQVGISQDYRDNSEPDQLHRSAGGMMEAGARKSNNYKRFQATPQAQPSAYAEDYRPASYTTPDVQHTTNKISNERLEEEKYLRDLRLGEDKYLREEKSTPKPLRQQQAWGASPSLRKLNLDDEQSPRVTDTPFVTPTAVRRVHEPAGMDSPREKIPSYDKKTGTFQEHLKQFELVAKWYGWDDARKAMALANSLKGTARSALLDVTEEDQTDYKRLVAVLTDRFEPKGQISTYLAQLGSRVRGKSESLVDLADDIRAMVRKAYPNLGAEGRDIVNLQITDWFIRSFNDVVLESAVRLTQPQTLSDALMVAQQHESIWARRSPGAKERQLVRRQQDVPAAEEVEDVQPTLAMIW